MSGFGASDVAREYRDDAESLRRANDKLRTALRSLRKACDWYRGDGELDKAKAEAAARTDKTPIGAVPVPRDLPALCLNPGCKNPPEAPGKGWCSRACWWADEGSMNEGTRLS